MSTLRFNPFRRSGAASTSRSRPRAPKALVAASVAALALGATAVYADSALPPVMTHDGVQYLSGGVGQGQATAIEGAARHWPLTLEFAANSKPRAEFLADVRVKVRDARGHTALNAEADGPFLLAKLAPGQYRIDATYSGRTLHRSVVVKAGQPSRLVFLWPAHTRSQA